MSVSNEINYEEIFSKYDLYSIVQNIGMYLMIIVTIVLLWKLLRYFSSKCPHNNVIQKGRRRFLCSDCNSILVG